MRCPGGLGKQCFYQKHLAEGTPPELVEVEVTERSGEHEVYVCVESLAGVDLARRRWACSSCTPGDRAASDLEQPGPSWSSTSTPARASPWRPSSTAARELRALLGELGLESFVKTHRRQGAARGGPDRARAPLGSPPRPSRRAVAELIAGREPERYVTSMAKAKRKGRIFLDYLRNGFGNTAVAPYSTRARPGAPVATPLRWEELGPSLTSDRYDIRNLPRRLATLRRDPWEGFLELRQRVPKAVLRQLKVS